MLIRPTIWLGLGAVVFVAWMTLSGPQAPSGPIASDVAKPALLVTQSVAPTATDGAIPTEKKARFAPTPPTALKLRKALYDASDILDAVKLVRLSGSADEKGWAAEIIRECSGYFSTEQHAHRVAGSTDSPQVEGQRLAAFEELQRRCEGISGVPLADRRQVTAELVDAAKASTSEFHDLTALYARHRRGDTRWTQAESKLVAESLYSRDALIKREAFLVLLSAIDRNAPSGKERSEALLFALADQTINKSLSTFERLAACAVVAMCDNAASVTTSPATPDRLQSLYLEAFAQRRSPEAILAIR